MPLLKEEKKNWPKADWKRPVSKKQQLRGEEKIGKDGKRTGYFDDDKTVCGFASSLALCCCFWIFISLFSRSRCVGILVPVALQPALLPLFCMA